MIYDKDNGRRVTFTQRRLVPSGELELVEVRARYAPGDPVDGGRWLNPWRRFRADGGMSEVGRAAMTAPEQIKAKAG